VSVTAQPSVQPIVVQKYGGSSVASTEKVRAVAKLVAAKKRAGYRVVVVVSAMGDATDELLARAKAISGEPDRRELDMLLSVGERISMSLLAMAIREEGEEAVSLTGSQSGILTSDSHANARIIEVRPFRVEDELERGRIVIVAGYQGVSYKKEITTLGRGGSDTTAVALAAALDAEACEIYSDVEGVFTTDPRIAPDAKKIPALGYPEMQELAEAGAKVLNAQAVEFAKEKGIAIYAKKTGSPDPGTVVRVNAPKPASGVRGVAFENELGVISGPATIEIGRKLLRGLDELEIHPKQIQIGGGVFSCVLSMENVHHEKKLARAVEDALGAGSLRSDLGAVSLIGEGITKTPKVLEAALGVLDREAIACSGVTTSSFRITFLLGATAAKKAAAALHAGLGVATAVDASE
jgi:aspartate kinase